MDRLSLKLPPGGRDLAIHHGQRRAHERWPLQAEVEVLEPGPGAGTTINASVGGLRVALDCPLRPGDLVVLRLRFPSGQETTEHGKVVWTRELRDGLIAGVQFVGQH